MLSSLLKVLEFDKIERIFGLKKAIIMQDVEWRPNCPSNISIVKPVIKEIIIRNRIDFPLGMLKIIVKYKNGII